MRIRFGKYRIPVPKSRTGRVGLGTVLVLLGFVPGPPGPAAIPIGLTMLTIDNPRGRRWRRVTIVRFGRRWQDYQAKKRMRRAGERGASGNDEAF
ncbi:hypothetical protein [Parvibaculum sp.]|uniref:hypothetical protein n=1 Tax=Parvibaculum sp. TaxID=2024848 RepID=UPI00391BE188